MFDSEPRGREGEAIEHLVGEAITATASTPAKKGVVSSPGGRRMFPERGLCDERRALLWVAAVAVVEALALVVIALAALVG